MTARPARAARLRAEREGRRAEWLAGLFLRLKGFRILARRFKSPAGEIDLVARRGGLVALIEVKTRPGLDEAVFAVTPKTRRRVEAAGRLFVARHPHLAALALRYDIIAVAGWRLRHIADAWREGER